MSGLQKTLGALILAPVAVGVAVVLWMAIAKSDPDRWKSKIIEDTEIKVRAHLKDPESANFQKVFLAPDGKTVCGEINAKNSFGGYIGFKPFFAFQDFVSIMGDDNNGFAKMWLENCAPTELEKIEKK